MVVALCCIYLLTIILDKHLFEPLQVSNQRFGTIEYMIVKSSWGLKVEAVNRLKEVIQASINDDHKVFVGQHALLVETDVVVHER